MKSGENNRQDGLAELRGGSWVSSSADFFRTVRLLYKNSKEQAEQTNGNFSSFTLAGIPLIFSGLRAFLIECNHGMYGISDERALIALGKAANELPLLRESYALTERQSRNLALLYEVRNEIIRPAHASPGNADGTPECLRPLQALNLLEEGTWISQLQSHRLFRWAMAVHEEVSLKVMKQHFGNEHWLSARIRFHSQYRK